MKNRFNLTFAYLTLLILAGCSLAIPPEPIAIYQLADNHITPQKEPIKATSLRINKPNTSGYLSTAKILVMNQPNQLSLYKGVQWKEPTPLLIRNHLLDSFRQANIMSELSSDDKRLTAAVELDMDLRSFQVEYHQNKASISIHLVVRLVEANRKQILASHQFTDRLVLNQDDIASVIEGFSLLQNRVSEQVVLWTGEALSRKEIRSSIKVI